MSKEVTGASASPTVALVNQAPTGLGPDGLRSTSGHTPGPWLVSEVTQTEVIGPHQRTICRAHRDAPTRSEEETRANARLIAAAPELLEALRTIRHQWAGHAEECAYVQDYENKCDCDWSKIARQCDSAIAKATGAA